MTSQPNKHITKFASYFDQELQATLPISILPDGSLVYKNFLVKQLENTYWGIFDIISKELINEYFLKSCALIAAKEYNHRQFSKYHAVKLLDDKYASSSNDQIIFSHNINLTSDPEKYAIMLTRLEESTAISQYYQKLILSLFRQSFI
jgi:hypothetical protein